MNKAKLRILNLDVVLDEKTNFYDDGFVEDILSHLEKVYYSTLKIKLPDVFVIEELLRPTIGRYVWLQPDGKNEHRIFYLDMKDDVFNTFVRAHEETHFIYSTKNTQLLEDAIMRDFGITLNINSLQKEPACHIGGIYGLLRKGYEKDYVLGLLRGKTLYEYEIAKEIWDKSKFYVEFFYKSKINSNK